MDGCFILYGQMLQIYRRMLQIYGPSFHNLRNVYNTMRILTNNVIYTSFRMNMLYIILIIVVNINIVSYEYILKFDILENPCH